MQEVGYLVTTWEQDIEDGKRHMARRSRVVGLIACLWTNLYRSSSSLVKNQILKYPI